MLLRPTGIIRSYEERKKYFFKVVLICLLCSAYFFAISNFGVQRVEPAIYNLSFGILFTFIYFLRYRYFESILIITGIFYQIFIFGHAFYLLPGKQLEGALGLMACLLPIFVSGFKLWFFFAINFILFHIILFNVGYGDIFYFQYLYYVVLFIVIYTIINVNKSYEKELLIQRDKIQRDAKHLKESDELKTRFFANISHELRTPLTLVLSPLESILKSNELSNRNFTYLLLVRQNAQKLLKRINELLELSRLDSKKLELQLQAVNIYQLTKHIAAIYESAANMKDIQLHYENLIDEHINLSLDVPKVEMILSNYLSNALKFTPKGGVIDLKIQKHKTKLLISVKDTGIGIPENELDKVFDRFYQVKNNDYSGGSGIGLALCKELAELHQGKVWVESDKGSTFYLELPYKETFAPVEASEPYTLANDTDPTIRATPEMPLTDSHLPRVLVVEDNPDLRQYMTMMLSEKYQVVTAEHGQAAWNILEQSSTNGQIPVAIISDIMMPVMDGMELLTALKNHDDFRTLPVIMLTAQKHSDVKIEALRIGVDDYLTKPFQAEELLARLKNLIGNAQLRLSTAIEADNSPKETTITTADMTWLKEVEDQIITHLDQTDFTLQQLAENLYITPRTLQKKIKNITGKTPKQYQRDIQMHIARQKLKNGEVQNVLELSQQLGFEDQYYFAKLYKKYFGVSIKEEMRVE